jgi:hypothetical protein
MFLSGITVLNIYCRLKSAFTARPSVSVDVVGVSYLGSQVIDSPNLAALDLA